MCIGNIHFETEEKTISINGIDNQILIFYIEPSVNNVIKTIDGKVYLRVGDKTKFLNHEQITHLEYDKGERVFEDLVEENSSFEDVDIELLEEYKKILKTNLTLEQILEARGLYVNHHLTNAGILLFAKFPTKFLPNARVRFLKFDGVKMDTGKNLNLIKDINLEKSIPRIIHDLKEIINIQLREFQFLDSDGRFKVIPEFPEFAWFEGVVNSLAHHNYAVRGDYIRISLYDDRMEIFSPGELPNLVTLENMLNTRYSRNPRIARVLCEFGWVKELNEGVKRIYDEMQSLFLKVPIYSEPNHNSVLLVLENSITSRKLRNDEKILKIIGEENMTNLNEYELKILQYLCINNMISTKITREILGKGEYFCRMTLANLTKKNILEWHGANKSDPTQYYCITAE